VLRGESTNTNCIVLGLTRSGIDPTIYRTRGDHVNLAPHVQFPCMKSAAHGQRSISARRGTQLGPIGIKRLENRII